ncbi:MAG: WD40 repeat domain-containing protein, partial [Dolichospermum sp.]
MNKILEIGQEKLTLKAHSDWVRAIAITPDGKTVISGSDDTTIKAWDLVTGQEKLTFEGHNNYVTAVAITPDGKTVISSSWDRTTKVWDLETGE